MALCLDDLTRRQTQIATAAAPTFLAKGFGHTTMTDIAAAAGLSRQALYATFRNKEDVFAAAVTVLHAAQRAEMLAEAACRSGLRARLVAVCERWTAGVFDLQQANPDAQDMDDLAFPIVRQVYEDFIRLVASLIDADAGTIVPPAGIGLLARSIVFGLRGYVAAATDAAEMRRLTVLHIDMALRYLESCDRVGAPEQDAPARAAVLRRAG